MPEEYVRRKEVLKVLKVHYLVREAAGNAWE